MIVYRDPNVITDEENPIVNITVDTLNKESGAMTLVQVEPVLSPEEPKCLFLISPRADAYNVTIDALTNVEVTVQEIVKLDDGDEESAELLERWVGTTTLEAGKQQEFTCSGEDMTGFKVYATPIEEEPPIEGEEPAEPDSNERIYSFFIDDSQLEEPDDPGEEIVDDSADKYAVTGETREIGGKTLSRIIALRDFANVRTGEFGGYVESATNLSQFGNCWVYDEAAVMDRAFVCDDAQVRGEAIIRDSAFVCDKAKVLDNALVCDEAGISDNSMVRDFACVAGTAYVSNTAKIQGNALVRDAVITDHSCIQNYACVLNGMIEGHAYIMGHSIVDQDITLGGFSRLDNRAMIVEDTNSLGNIYVRLQSLTTGVEGMSYEKVEGENTFRVNVIEGQVLPVIATATDPRASLKVLYLGNGSLGDAVDISDDPRIGWPQGTAGMTDTLAILIENEHFPNIRGLYTIEVTVVERLPIVPDEPIIEEEPLLRGVRTIPAYTSLETDEGFYFNIPVDETVTIVPELRDDAELVEIVFQGFDISDCPSVFYPQEFLGKTDEIEIVVKQRDSEDVITYLLMFHIVNADDIGDKVEV